MKDNILSVKNLAQIREGAVSFGDFTLVVGPQASGKSIFLQLLKLIIDRHHIKDTLKTNGFEWGSRPDRFLELFYGESMSGMWKENSIVTFQGKNFTRESIQPTKRAGAVAREEHLFYVPAQRVVTMHQGWPRNFGAFDIGDPYVLRSFSESVRILMERESSNWQGGG